MYYDIFVENDALHMASQDGYLDVVKSLVEDGADIHSDNDCALQLASEAGHLDVVKYLVENGADIHAENERALKMASEEGHIDVVKYLVEKGADNAFALVIASEKSSTTEWNVFNDIVLFLLENRADKSKIPEELYNYITGANDTKPAKC